MKHQALPFFLLVALGASCVSATPGNLPDAPLLGAEVRAYPAGVIPTVNLRWPLSEEELFGVSVGYNATDRQDFGEHDDESGGGPGFGLDYRRYFGGEYTGWYVGGRADLWFLEIDWKDDPAFEGSTDVIVLQPTLEGGYSWRLGERWRLELGLGLGAEINVHTSGEDVGEGAILLGGATFTYGF